MLGGHGCSQELLELLHAAAAFQGKEAMEAHLVTPGTSTLCALSLGDKVPVHVLQEATARRMQFLVQCYRAYDGVRT
jgi:hypothetical protein